MYLPNLPTYLCIPVRHCVCVVGITYCRLYTWQHARLDSKYTCCFVCCRCRWTRITACLFGYIWACKIGYYCLPLSLPRLYSHLHCPPRWHSSRHLQSCAHSRPLGFSQLSAACPPASQQNPQHPLQSVPLHSIPIHLSSRHVHQSSASRALGAAPHIPSKISLHTHKVKASRTTGIKEAEQLKHPRQMRNRRSQSLLLIFSTSARSLRHRAHAFFRAVRFPRIGGDFAQHFCCCTMLFVFGLGRLES